jgi:hypothetical protein
VVDDLKVRARQDNDDVLALHFDVKYHYMILANASDNDTSSGYSFRDPRVRLHRVAGRQADVCHRSKISFQLIDIELWRKARIRRLRR